jgi:hypothetical protein
MSAGVFAPACGAGEAGPKVPNALAVNSIALTIVPFERIECSLTRSDRLCLNGSVVAGSGVLDR